MLTRSRTESLRDLRWQMRQVRALIAALERLARLRGGADGEV